MNTKRILRTLILLLVRIIGAPGAYFLRRTVDSKPAPRILVIRPDHLGDLILVTPILHALKAQAPDAHITMMVGPWSREVVARHPAIDTTLTCPFPGFQRASQKPLAPYLLLFQTARQLRSAQYDLAINLRPDFWWGAALIYLTGIPRRAGYAIQPGTPFITHKLAALEPEHATVSNLRLASAGLLSLSYNKLDEPYTPERYPLHFVPTQEERNWIDERLTTAGITAEMPLIVIHPGTGAAVKLWRNEAWSQCANSINEARPSLQHIHVILTGSPAERPLLEEIASGIHTPPLLLSDMTVGQLAAILARALCVLGVDSGPLHLAVAQNTRTLQLFGPTDERIFGPWGAPERHSIIRTTQKCPGCPAIPCGRLDFGPDEVSQHLCVRSIPEKQVERALTSMLAQYSSK
ncbi:MAG: glycosyltransferase family 9 protein [Ktedonobacteraceae bacterium]|nr:glycosyltransferase family 9 protein [Ktedonobacteraceae bacterium]